MHEIIKSRNKSNICLLLHTKLRTENESCSRTQTYSMLPSAETLVTGTLGRTILKLSRSKVFCCTGQIRTHIDMCKSLGHRAHWTHFAERAIALMPSDRAIACRAIVTGVRI